MRAIAVLIPVLVLLALGFLVGRLTVHRINIKPLKTQLLAQQEFIDEVRRQALSRAMLDPEFSTILLDEITKLHRKESHDVQGS
jgi:hypothetical protein